MKVLIFGAGKRGIRLYNYLQRRSDEYQVIAFLDNNAEKIAEKFGKRGDMPRLPVLKPEKSLNIDFDEIIISNIKLNEIIEIEQQLQF